jgi:hypothetical protein
MIQLVSPHYLGQRVRLIFCTLQLWEDLSSFRGELKKAAQAKVCILYSLLPNREPGEGRMNEARYVDELKAAVLNVLEQSKFLHNGKDGNVCVSFRAAT